MKKYISLLFVISSLCILSFIPIYAQSSNDEILELWKQFRNLYKNSSECNPALRDAQGNCVNPDEVINRCLAQGKLDKNGNYNEACCLTDEQCKANQKPGEPEQTCTIGNGFCKSGYSCNNNQSTPNIDPTPTSSRTGANPTPKNVPNPTSKTSNPGNPDLGNFTYYCQSDVKWQNNGCYQYDLTYNGCCPTAAAMVMNSLGVSMDPVRMDQIFRNKGLRVCGGYCRLASDTRVGNQLYIEDILRQNGLGVGPDLVVWNPQAGKSLFDVRAAQAALARGNYILAYVGRYPAGKCCEGQVFNGHAFAIDKIICPNNDISQCKIRVRDPSNCGPDFREGVEDRFIYRDVSLLTDNGAFPIGRIQ